MLLGNEDYLTTDHLSSPDRSDLELCRYTRTLQKIDEVLENPTFNKYRGLWETVKKQALPLGPDLVKAFCAFHASAEYSEADAARLRTCPNKLMQPWIDRKEVDKAFNESCVLDLNVSTFVSAEVAEILQGKKQ